MGEEILTAGFGPAAGGWAALAWVNNRGRGKICLIGGKWESTGTGDACADLSPRIIGGWTERKAKVMAQKKRR
jgi:hypothetical protein